MYTALDTLGRVNACIFRTLVFELPLRRDFQAALGFCMFATFKIMTCIVFLYVHFCLLTESTSTIA